MYSINLVVRKNKVNRTGQTPIYIRVSKDRRTSYISTGQRVLASYWDDRSARVTSKHPNSKKMNLLLSKKFFEVQHIALTLEERGQHFTAKSVKDKYLNASDLDFMDFAFAKTKERFHSGDEDKIGFGTYRRYVAVLNKLQEYLGDQGLRFHNFTPRFLKDYMAYLKNALHNTPNTINSNLRCLRSLLNLAKKEGIVPDSFNPFKAIKLPSANSSRGYLEIMEMNLIEELVLRKDSKIALHRDMFVFAYYAGGMRVSDVLMLRVENYDGKYIHYEMRKNGKNPRLLLPRKAREIITKYLTPLSRPKDFIFPCLNLDPGAQNEKRVFRAISGATAKINKDLKEIAKKVGISKNLSFHVARHTFGTAAITKGLDLYTVSNLMAHSDQETTRGYAKIINPLLDEAMRKFE